MSCEKLVILNKPLKFKISKGKPNCSPFYMREAPGTAHGGISIKPISCLTKLLQLVMRRTRLAVSAVLTTDHLFWLEGSQSSVPDTCQVIPVIESDRADQPRVGLRGDGLYGAYVSECMFAPSFVT